MKKSFEIRGTDTIQWWFFAGKKPCPTLPVGIGHRARALKTIGDFLGVESVIIETGTAVVDSCVIWLHGLGADGHDFEPIVPELRLPPTMNTRFLFPHAPMMPVTINQGFVMRAWYDIKSAEIASQPDEAGIRGSAELVNQLVEEQLAQGISASRIVLAGFSQGGAVVLQAGLRQRHTLAVIMALSGC